MLLLLLAVVAVFAFGAWRRAQAHAWEIQLLKSQMAALTARLEGLERQRTQPTPAAASAVAPAQAAQGSDPVATRMRPGSDLGPKVPTASPVGQSTPAATDVGARQETTLHQEVTPIASAEELPAPTGSDPAATRMRPRSDLPPTPAPTTPAPGARAPIDSLETRIGARWLLYIGVAAIVIGVSYFEKLAIDNHWINETARTIQAGVFGALLIYAGIRFVRSGYRTYGQMISGGGVAVLYVSVYAAFNLYHLVAQMTAFALMSAITALAAWLADRQRSQGLALMAVGGGFVTPFLLPGQTDAEIALFTYDAILIAGTMYLAHRRVWPLLNTVSYAITVLTVLGWQARFYTPVKYLPTELFLTLFCAMFLYVLRESYRSSQPAARLARIVLWTAPAAYYVASLAILSSHGVALLVYLVALSLVGAAVGRQVGPIARLACWIAAEAPLAVWLDAHGVRTWMVAGLAAVAGIYMINLVCDLERALRNDEPIEPTAIVLLHLNGLASFGCAYLMVDAVVNAASAPLAAGFALWHAAIGIAVHSRRRDTALHFGSIAGSLGAIAIALQYQGAAAVAGWAAEGTGIVWLGLRERREWFRMGGLALFGFAIVQLLSLQIAEPALPHIVLLNAKAASGLFVALLTLGLARLHDRDVNVPARAAQVGACLTASALLTLTTTTAEIVDYWKLNPHDVFEPLAQIAIAMLIVGSVIVWLGLHRRQEWIRGTGALVVAAAALLVLQLQFGETPGQYTVVLNARAAAGAIAIATLYSLAMLHQRRGQHLAQASSQIAVLITAASLFTLSLLTSEIDAYWAGKGAARVWSTAREGLQAIVWATIGSAIIWIGVTRRGLWIRAIGAAVLVTGILRLVDAEFVAAPLGYVVVANTRFVAAVIVIAALAGLARLYGSLDEPLDAPLRPRTVLLFAANALALTMLTSEITAFWHVQDLNVATAVTPARDSHFARELMLSATWAIYAAGLIVVGIRKAYAPIRYFGIALFAVTIAKVFGVDMAELDRIYRVSSIIVLGVMLLATSYFYNRYRSQLAPREDV